MNKKDYIKPTMMQHVVAGEAILAGSTKSISYGGDDNGNTGGIVPTAESKAMRSWDDED